MSSEGRRKDARAYTYREHKAYTEFPGNRSIIQQQYDLLIPSVARTNTKDIPGRDEVEKALFQVEEKGWHITTAVHSIWADEKQLPPMLDSDLKCQVRCKTGLI